MILFFWTCVFIIFYTFIGYPILLFILIQIKQLFKKPFLITPLTEYPTVTLLIPAYNEIDIIDEKIKNCLLLNYPKDKLQIIFITDGSNDGSNHIIKAFPEIELLHEDVRKGKTAAIKRAIPFVKGEFIIFSDANTFLNSDAIIELLKNFQNPKVGAVAGEKRVIDDLQTDASSIGESTYWKYESLVKTLDFKFHTTIGAAGELFSIRTNLYEPIETDTIVDDLMITIRIAEKGHIIAYEPKAYATETASCNTKEELKRKIRIAAGGIQSMLRLTKSANPFYNPILTFQYISHKVLRWTITPWLMILVLFLNAFICFYYPDEILYKLILIAQIIFYAASLVGYSLESYKIKIKFLFIPFYFTMMNYAIIAGTFRFLKGNQSAVWEKSKRR